MSSSTNQNTNARSMNGIISIDDGAGTTIEDGSITTNNLEVLGDINVNNIAVNNEITADIFSLSFPDSSSKFNIDDVMSISKSTISLNPYIYLNGSVIVGSVLSIQDPFNQIYVVGDNNLIYNANKNVNSKHTFTVQGTTIETIDKDGVTIASGKYLKSPSITLGTDDLQGLLNLKANYSLVSNVNNTSDLNKPISTATQNALNLKAPINNPTFTGALTIPNTIIFNGGTVNSNYFGLNPQNEIMAYSMKGGHAFYTNGVGTVLITQLGIFVTGTIQIYDGIYIDTINGNYMRFHSNVIDGGFTFHSNTNDTEICRINPTGISNVKKIQLFSTVPDTIQYSQNFTIPSPVVSQIYQTYADYGTAVNGQATMDYGIRIGGGLQHYVGAYGSISTKNTGTLVEVIKFNNDGVTIPILTSTTQTAGDSSTKVATTAFVTSANGNFAKTNSTNTFTQASTNNFYGATTFFGSVACATQSNTTSSTLVASTSFVRNQPFTKIMGTVQRGASNVYSLVRNVGFTSLVVTSPTITNPIFTFNFLINPPINDYFYVTAMGVAVDDQSTDNMLSFMVYEKTITPYIQSPNIGTITYYICSFKLRYISTRSSSQVPMDTVGGYFDVQVSF